MTPAFVHVSPTMAVSPIALHPRSSFVSFHPASLSPPPMASSSSPFISPRPLLHPAFPLPTIIRPASCPRLDLYMSTPITSSSSSSSPSPSASASASSSDPSAAAAAAASSGNGAASSSSSSSSSNANANGNGSVSVESSSAFQPKEYTQQEVEQLAEFIQNGPVYRTAKLTLRPIDENDPRCFTDSFQTCMDDWLHMGSILEEALGTRDNVRVYQYYLPIYFWLLRELDRFADRLASDPDALPRPFIMGFCCPQGGGKTTMTTFMATLLRKMGKSVQVASLDDFYVTNAEQNAIAARYTDNPLMQYRGMPGTHDVQLLTDTLDDLRLGRPVAIPKYDKTAFEGRGDRAPRDQWKRISGTTDIVLLEGWCLGFEKAPTDSLHSDDLSVVNEALREFDEVYRRIDGLFLIEISDMEWVFDWRLQAERGTRALGKPGLSDEQVTDFVSRFMPAYKQYSPRLYGRAQPLFPDHELHIEIDQQRRPVHTPRSRL